MSRQRAHRLDTALGLGGARGPAGIVGKTILYAVLVFIFAGPLIALAVSSFGKIYDPTKLSIIPHGFTLDNFREAFDQHALKYLANSLIVVGGGLLLQILVSISAAYALARKRFPGMQLVLLLILSTMMLPEEILAIPLSIALSDVVPGGVVHIDITNSLIGMIVPLGAWAFSILVMTEFMKEVPLELEEAARIDGAGDLRIFVSVVLPLCRPALGVIGIFGFTMIWDQYILPLLVAQDSSKWTIALALNSLRADDTVGTGVVVASAMLALLPSVIAFLALQRQFMRGLTSGAIKG
jgi:multiple sugar transport system permease protein